MIEQRPDVLLLCVDDMNDWVGCLGGYPGVRTPNIDRLAARGTLFGNAHCPSPVCNPSRTAILTGWAPHRSGVYDNQHWWRPAHPDLVSLPVRFREAGYRVAGAVGIGGLPARSAKKPLITAASGAAAGRISSGAGPPSACRLGSQKAMSTSGCASTARFQSTSSARPSRKQRLSLRTS